MVSAAVVSFPDAHGVMREVDIAVVAWVSVSMWRATRRVGESYRRVLWMSAESSDWRGRGNLYLGILKIATFEQLFLLDIVAELRVGLKATRTI